MFYPEEIGAYLWATGNCGERELWRTGNCGGQGIVGTGNCGDREVGDRELDLQLPYNQYRKRGRAIWTPYEQALPTRMRVWNVNLSTQSHRLLGWWIH